MSDHTLEIFTVLEKHDNFVNDSVLFGKNAPKYENILQNLYESKLIERDILLDDGIETKRTKLTDKGRDYFFHEFLPKIRSSSIPITNEHQHPIKTWFSENIVAIIAIIVTIVIFYLGLK